MEKHKDRFTATPSQIGKVTYSDKGKKALAVLNSSNKKTSGKKKSK